MYTRSVPLALLSLLVGLGSAASARADIIYTFTGTSPAGPNGLLNGSFTVPDAAITDGLITAAEITTYSFTDAFATFAPPSFSFYVTLAIPVDKTTGKMTGLGFLDIWEEDPDPPHPLEVLAPLSTGPDVVLYTRVGDGGVGRGGEGFWTNSSTPAVVPEPTSLTLVLVVGIAGLAGTAVARRRRRASPAP